MGFRHFSQPCPSIRPYMQFLFVQSGFPLELPLPRFVTSPQLLHARPTGTHPCRANTPCLANQPYSRRLLCSSGLGFRIIAAPCGLSPQYAYRVGRTNEAPRPGRTLGGGWWGFTSAAARSWELSRARTRQSPGLSLLGWGYYFS